MQIAQAASASCKWSRADTASIAFSTTPSKPKSSAVRARSIGSPVPAIAQAPSGRAVDPACRVGEALAIPGQRPEVGQQMVAQEHRLPSLQVRVAGKQRASVALDAVEQDSDQLTDLAVQLRQRALEPEAYAGRRLVVAGARGVELPPGVAELLGQPCFDRHVQIFVSRVGAPLPRRQLAADPLETTHERFRFLLRDQAALAEHRRVGDRPVDLLLGHAQIDVERGGEAKHLLARRTAETAAQPAHSPSEMRLAPSVRNRSTDRRMKPGRVRLVVHLVGLEARERLVVQRVGRRTAAFHGERSLVELDPRLAVDPGLHRVHERLQRLALGAEPEPVVDHLRVARDQLVA